MKELLDDEREAAIVVPVVVRPIVVRVQPATIVVAVRIKQVRIAVGTRTAHPCNRETFIVFVI